MLSGNREAQTITLCRDLLRVESYSGNEKAVADRLERAFTELGFDDSYTDEYGNVTGRIKGLKPGPSILFDGHMDTVPVGNTAEWTFDPFSAVVDQGRIYGRGASDMKGALSAMACAAAFFAEDRKRDFAGEIQVAGVVHEECFEGIASRSISSRVRPDYVVIGEASGLNLKIGQRGRAEIIVETFGRPAHSANPEQGINAIKKMMKLIERIDHLPVNRQDILGEGILVLTDIKSLPYPAASVVPEYCRATYDRRLLVGETADSILQPITEIIAALEQEDPDFKAQVSIARGKERCYTGKEIEGQRFFPAWLFDPGSEFVRQVLDGLRASGLDPAIAHYSFCTNGSHYAGEAGIRTIGFGPSAENLAHTADEYIEIDQLLKAVQGYYAIAGALLNRSSAAAEAVQQPQGC